MLYVFNLSLLLTFNDPIQQYSTNNQVYFSLFFIAEVKKVCPIL